MNTRAGFIVWLFATVFFIFAIVNTTQKHFQEVQKRSYTCYTFIYGLNGRAIVSEVETFKYSQLAAIKEGEKFNTDYIITDVDTLTRTFYVKYNTVINDTISDGRMSCFVQD